MLLVSRWIVMNYQRLILLCCAVLSLPVSGEIPTWVFDDKRELKTFNFRYAEGSLRTQKTDEWIKRWDNADGIVIKSLNEEVSPFEGNSHKTLKQFKHKNPNQLLLLHFNGRSRLPSFSPEKMKASDFLYLLGTTSVTPITDNDEISVVKVENVRAFKRNRSLAKGVYDDVVMVRKKNNGSLDWNYTEHAKLLKVDVKNKAITIQRDLLASGKKAFAPQEAYIALHASKGPFDKTVKQRLWEYNWFYAGKTADSDKGLSKRLAQELSSYLMGSLNFFDGITFDVLTEFHQPKIGGYPGPIDVDQNGIKDDEEEYDALHKAGVNAFLSNLRLEVGNSKLLLADGGYINQKEVHLLNGMESEGWPNNKDLNLEHWSSGMNRYSFWSTFSALPRLNYVKLAEYWNENREKTVPQDNIRRLTVAAALMNDTVIVPAHRPRGIHYQKWPELRLFKKLGKPLNDVIHFTGKVTLPIETTSFENEDDIAFPTLNFRNNKVPPQQCFKIEKQHNGPLSISLKGKLSKGSDVATLIIKPHNAEEKFGLLNDELFENWFYWSDIQANKFCIAVSNNTPVSIASITVFGEPLVSYREFENGLVFTNLSESPLNIPIKDLKLSKQYHSDAFQIEARDITIIKH